MVISRLADEIVARADAARAVVEEAFFEPVIRLGVTGPSRAGKTVFITSLVANLMNRSMMKGLSAEAQGRIGAAYLQPQPDDLIPRFDYEKNLDILTGPEPSWTAGTDRISELRLSLRVSAGGAFASLRSDRRVHIDIVDYPGEWLLDLGLLQQDFDAWATPLLDRLRQRREADAFLAAVNSIDPSDKFDETRAKELAGLYRDYLVAARQQGYFDTTPGRFLLPGDLEGSPALTFAPMAGAKNSKRGTFGFEFSRRYEAYKSKIVRPFFRDHFARIDRQVVLVDPLTALANGPRALADLEGAMATTLEAFKPGKNGVLQTLLRGRRIERILFAATKADALHSSQHDALTALTTALLQGATDRAAFAGAQVKAMAIASLRATTEETRNDLDMVLGRVEGRDRPIASYPGTLPAAPGDLLSAARSGAETWGLSGFEAPKFLPRPFNQSPGKSLPHIRLDRAAEFLLGDLL